MLTSKSIGVGGLGRFGNQLWTIAGVIGIAIKSGQPYGFPHWKNYDNANFGGEVTDFEDVFVNPLPAIVDVPFQDYGYFWGYRDIHLPTGNWSIDAHLQSQRYFAHCMPLIREQFRMKGEPEQNDYVAIHYRAGDYTEGKETYHPRQGIEYYLQAMALFPQDAQFIIFSDDIQAIEELRHNKDYFRRTILAGGSYLEDFRLMKRCKHFITANSSFSVMAAILGEHPDKKIICPSLWFGAAAGGLDASDIYPQGAVVI